MAYTAIEKMRRENEKRFGADLGPWQPPLYTNRRNRNDLKSAALRFLHNRCEELHFDTEKKEQEKWAFEVAPDPIPEADISETIVHTEESL